MGSGDSEIAIYIVARENEREREIDKRLRGVSAVKETEGEPALVSYRSLCLFFRIAKVNFGPKIDGVMIVKVSSTATGIAKCINLFRCLTTL